MKMVLTIAGVLLLFAAAALVGIPLLSFAWSWWTLALGFSVGLTLDFWVGVGAGIYGTGVIGTAFATSATKEPWPDRLAIIFGWPIAMVHILCRD